MIPLLHHTKILLGQSPLWKIKLIHVGPWDQRLELPHLSYGTLASFLGLLLGLDEVGIIGQLPNPVAEELHDACSSRLVLLSQAVSQVPVT